MSVSWKQNEYNKKLQTLRAEYGVSQEYKEQETVVVDTDNQIVALPQTKDELSSLVTTIIGAYNWPDNDDTLEQVAALICAAPKESDHVTLGYFGTRLKRNRAHVVAYQVLEAFATDRRQKAKDAELALKKEQAETLANNGVSDAGLTENQAAT
jgi:hypothetical protein